MIRVLNDVKESCRVTATFIFFSFSFFFFARRIQLYSVPKGQERFLFIYFFLLGNNHDNHMKRQRRESLTRDFIEFEYKKKKNSYRSIAAHVCVQL